MGNRHSEMEKAQRSSEGSTMTFRRGNTTYHVGVHFNKSSKATIDDKIRSMIMNDLKNETNNG